MCTFFTKQEEFKEGRGYYATGVKHVADETRKKILIAFDVESAQIIWKYPQVGGGWSSGGVMTTAGGVVFFGDETQSFEAVDARTGAPLWHFLAGQGIHASPMSYEVSGKQYVAIAAGNDLFSFALP